MATCSHDKDIWGVCERERQKEGGEVEAGRRGGRVGGSRRSREMREEGWERMSVCGRVREGGKDGD